MRNRAIELFLPLSQAVNELNVNQDCQNSQMTRLESWNSYLGQTFDNEEVSVIIDTAMAALSKADIQLLPRMMSQCALGLMPNFDGQKGLLSLSARKFLDLTGSDIGRPYERLYDEIANALQLPSSYQKYQVSWLYVASYSSLTGV
jgi:hypothetical protein